MKSVLKPPSTAQEVTTLDELALARILEECLQAMEHGETDLDRLAGRYPEAQEEIRPLLDIARQLGKRRSVGPPLALEFLEELRGRLMSRPAGR